MRTWTAVVLLGLVWPLTARAQAPTPAQKQATVSWIQSMQKDNGGFAANKEAKASLPATTSALRALKYFDGELKNGDACKKFVLACYDKVETGFATTPGGKADVHTTAVALLAIKELNVSAPEYLVKPVIFLCAHAQTFEETRIAAAAYEAIGSKCELSANWITRIENTRNKDGTYGKGGDVARQTASAVVTLLRLGAEVEQRENVVKALRAGQRPDGGWGKDGEASDLETTYRVLRAFVMFKARPDDPAPAGRSWGAAATTTAVTACVPGSREA